MRIGSVGATYDVELEGGAVTLRFARCALTAALAMNLRAQVAEQLEGADVATEDDLGLAIGLMDPGRIAALLTQFGEVLSGWSGIEDEDGKPATPGPSQWQQFLGGYANRLQVLVLMLIATICKTVEADSPDPTASECSPDSPTE